MMSKGLQRSNINGPNTNVITKEIPVNIQVNCSVGAPGFGTAILLGLPRGNLLITEVTADLAFSALVNGVANPNVSAAFTGNFSIGTTATADNVLATTDVNLVASTAMNTASAAISAVKHAAGTVLNLLIDNSDSVSGTTAKLVSTGNSASSVTVKTGPQITANLNFTIANVTTAPVLVNVVGMVYITYSVTGNY
jgi:hypothetical protein